MRVLAVLCLVAVVAGCNAPPLYEQRAREFLAHTATPADVIERLTHRRPLTPAEAERLATYDHIAVLHLVAANPGTPVFLLQQLARHDNFEVRTGVAVNPRAPLETLLSLRTPGRYTTVNTMLARNPVLPSSLLWEMYENGEASLLDLGLNPGCPPELMGIIARDGSELDRTWLATNPNLPPELMARLARDESQRVRDHLATNPAWQPPEAEPPRPEPGGSGG